MEGQKTAAKAVASPRSVPLIAARNVGTISVADIWFHASHEMQCLRCKYLAVTMSSPENDQRVVAGDARRVGI